MKSDLIQPSLNVLLTEMIVERINTMERVDDIFNGPDQRTTNSTLFPAPSLVLLLVVIDSD